jgi:hypothetical protein
LNPMQSENLARRLAEHADSKKAEDIVVLDMRGLVAYTDFLVICTARNERQARGIVDEVRQRVKHESGVLPSGVDAQRRRRRRRSGMDDRRLPRHGSARLHAGSARALPTRRPLA